MWKYQKNEIDNGFRYKILEEEKIISFAEWIEHLRCSSEFRSFFIDILISIEFEGFFWEVKPITSNTLNTNFEFVVIESRRLPQIPANSESFKEHFNLAKEVEVVVFPNLGGDATLIVPLPTSNHHNYGHLAAFLKSAPLSQLDEFWEVVGTEYKKTISDTPKWLSTAGLGVPWLHLRIDSRPKYYRFEEYK